MGDLDKFIGKGGAPTTSKGIAQPKMDTAALANVGSRENSAAERILRKSPVRFAIALDGTGSMSGLIAMAKMSIAEILRRVIAGAGRTVEIMLVVYRDYDVPNQVVEISPVTTDANSLIAWLGRVHAHGGGNNDGEAIERALEAIQTAGPFEAAMIAGDEPPNSRTSLRQAGRADSLHAEDFAQRFGQTGMPIHTFIVGNDIRTVKAFASLASLSGGRSGRLDGSAEMIDMAVMAMLAKLKGAAGVTDYLRDHQVVGRAAEFGQLLIGGPKK